MPALPPPARAPEERIALIDALRGSALAGLFLVHCVEHFELSLYPEDAPPLLQRLDAWTHSAAFFLFSGKAYAIFALMFGVSFMLLLQSWTRQGVDVRTRFPWRLLLLGAMGYLNGILYNGDILLVLAILGLPLVLLHRLPDKVLGWLAFLLLLQLPNAWKAVGCLLHPEIEPWEPVHWGIYGRVREIAAHGSLWDMVRTNLGDGQAVRLWFTLETGRYTQMLGLFTVGLLLGRHHLMENPAAARRLGWRALILGGVGFLVLYPLGPLLDGWGVTGLRGYYVSTWLNAYSGLAQMAVWVGGFIVLYLHPGWRRWLEHFAPLGRMSLTGYVAQALFFVPLFYNYGLGLYRHLGQFYSELIGVAFIMGHLWAARLWLRHFHYGPLEWLWRAATIRSWRTPFRRRAAALTPQPADTPALAMD